MNKHIEKAIDIAGSQAALAELIGMSQAGIHYLLRGGKRKIKVKTAEAIAKATNNRVRRCDLRPDVFPPPRKRN